MEEDFKNKVCHITLEINIDTDSRIYQQCVGLVGAGFEVHLISFGQPDVAQNGIIFHSLDYPSSSFFRHSKLMKSIKQRIEAIDADIYHLYHFDLLELSFSIKSQWNMTIYEVLSKEKQGKSWNPLQFTIQRKREIYAAADVNAIVVQDAEDKQTFFERNPNTIYMDSQAANSTAEMKKLLVLYRKLILTAAK